MEIIISCVCSVIISTIVSIILNYVSNINHFNRVEKILNDCIAKVKK